MAVTRRVPTDVADGQTAIGLSANTDTVEFESASSPFIGANNRNLDTLGLDNFTIRGDGANPSDTVLDCQNAERGVYITTSLNFTLENIRITDGYESLSDGGGVYWLGPNATGQMEDVIIDNCEANWGGGVMGAGSSIVTMTNCLIHNNKASRLAAKYGAGISVYAGSTSFTINNCTIAKNTHTNVGGMGGGVSVYGGTANATLTDCIVYDNIANGGGHQLYNLAGTSTGSLNYGRYNAGAGHVGGVWTITNSTTGDPLFVNTIGDDFHLQHIAAGQGNDSPCIDTGSDTAVNLGFDDKTTRTDGITDSGQVDIGWHFFTGEPDDRAKKHHDMMRRHRYDVSRIYCGG